MATLRAGISGQEHSTSFGAESREIDTIVWRETGFVSSNLRANIDQSPNYALQIMSTPTRVLPARAQDSCLLLLCVSLLLVYLRAPVRSP